MKLYLLSLNTIVCKKTVFIFAALLLVLPWLLPHLTPWEEKPSLLQPARAQAAWTLLWISGLAWLLYQGATLGNQHFRNGILQYFKTTGLKRGPQLLQITAGCLTGFLLLALITLAISLFGAMPADPYEAKHWFILNFQYLFLLGGVVVPLLLLAISLGTRINSVVAFLISCGLGLYGLFGLTYLDFFLAESANPTINLLYTISPHYHLADLTERLVFKMGALSASAFASITLYLAGISLVFGTAAFFVYRENA